LGSSNLLATHHIGQKMVTKLLSLVTLIFGTAACCAATTGIIKLNVGNEARLYTSSALSANDFVHFQYPDKAAATRCCLRRRSSAFQLIEADPAASDALAGNPVFTYELLKAPALTVKTPFFGAAVAGSKLTVKQINTETLKVRSRDASFVVNKCTGQEGMHVITKASADVVADLYFWFDFQVEKPTCPTQ
jgi:hypothetical protein